MKFSEVIGQHAAQQRLLRMVADGTLPHALLLCGDTGYGTLALAVAFASYLLGEREEGTNANLSAMLSTFQHPDLHFIVPVIRPPKTPSERKITTDDFLPQWVSLLRATPYFHLDEWLRRMNADNQQAVIYTAEGDSIAHRLSLKASLRGYKVCIVWLPERMHATFANKMLKLLEEPPAQTLFLLVSEEPQLLLATIRSRMQRFEVKPIAADDIARALVSRRGIAADMAQQVARIAGGSWLAATAFLDSESERVAFHASFVAVLRMAYERDVRGMKGWSNDIATYGREKQLRLVAYFAAQFRENFACNFSQPAIVYMTPAEQQFATNFAPFINGGNVRALLALCDRTAAAIGQNANAKMQFFDAALQIARLLRQK